MPPIGPTNNVSTLIRAMLARQGKRPPAALGAGARPRRSGGPASLAQMLASRVRAIEADDPDRRSKVLRAFLEANLLAEFGEQLANEPQFARMVSDVQNQMEGDEHLAAALDRTVETLLATTSPPAAD